MTGTGMEQRARIGLCFHGIGARQRRLESDEEYYWVSKDQFLRILDDVANMEHVQLSFDDGNASDIEIALPALQERGLHAVFYALAGRLDRSGSLSADDLRALVRSGMDVGTHGWHHVPWPGLSEADLRLEVSSARDRLGDVIGMPISAAALPMGRYDRRVLSRLRREGYATVSTSDRAVARAGSWLQPRFSVHSHDTPDSIRATITDAARSTRVWSSSARRALKGLR